ncbi:hypothetical protein AJ88_37590 [Mesorhizobium amorphae CCBAU 01583]|nr:hypothetical protein AJ88_37590 [Mesorhizobium amorphae CCBAU 01583]
MARQDRQVRDHERKFHGISFYSFAEGLTWIGKNVVAMALAPDQARAAIIDNDAEGSWPTGTEQDSGFPPRRDRLDSWTSNGTGHVFAIAPVCGGIVVSLGSPNIRNAGARARGLCQKDAEK